jgi:hypothetical protein
MTFREAITKQPFTAALVAIVLVWLCGALGTAGYWVWWQDDPAIVVAEQPYSNDGANAAGESFVQWVNDGKPPLDWKPTPKSDFRAGETLWIVRHDCFLFKTSGPITRTFRGGAPNGIIYQLQNLNPPTRTSGCKKANFATQIPIDLPPGDYTYEVAVLFYKNPLRPEVRAEFPPVAFTIVK